MNNSHDLVSPPNLVLDTNVVLDWLVFNDARCRPVIDAIEAGQVRWLATEAMRDELVSVLVRPFRSGRVVDTAAVLDTWQRWSDAADTPAPVPPFRFLHCADPDDQMFIDLAIATEARWLLTRDRALLALTRRARAFGAAVQRPEDWRFDL